MAITALQKIIKGAKILQKKNKNLSWKEAVQKSSKEYNSGKKQIKKKASVKKSVGKKIQSIKKAPIKKARHIDTKSHNVNIRVVSGFKNDGIIQEYEKALNELDFNKNFLFKAKKRVTELRKKGYARENADRSKKIDWGNALHDLIMYSDNVKLYTKRLSYLKKQL